MKREWRKRYWDSFARTNTLIHSFCFSVSRIPLNATVRWAMSEKSESRRDVRRGTAEIAVDIAIIIASAIAERASILNDFLSVIWTTNLHCANVIWIFCVQHALGVLFTKFTTTQSIPENSKTLKEHHSFPPHSRRVAVLILLFKPQQFPQCISQISHDELFGRILASYYIFSLQ